MSDTTSTLTPIGTLFGADLFIKTDDPTVAEAAKAWIEQGPTQANLIDVVAQARKGAQ